MIFRSAACFLYTMNRIMKSYTLYWWIGLAFLLVHLVRPASGQQAGDMDTSFAVRPNYGALRPVEKAWALADGSVLCFQEGENYFSGKKTGSFFKIRPDGNLDTSYHGTVLRFLCWQSMCSCEYFGYYLHLLPDESVLLFYMGKVSINGSIHDENLVKFSPQGYLENIIQPIPQWFGGIDYGGDLQPVVRGNRLLVFNNDSAYLYTENLERDTLFQPFHFINSNEYPIKVLVQSKSVNYVVNFQYTHLKYLPLKQDSNYFSTPFLSGTENGVVPMPIETDQWGRIYEFYKNADTIDDQIFHQVRRRLSTGHLDTGYQVRFQRADIEHFSDALASKMFKVDSLGIVWVYSRGGIVVDKGLPDNYLFDQNPRLEGGWFWRFSSETGAFLDSIFLKPYTREVISGNQKITLGWDKDNRWSFIRKEASGQELLKRVSHFGANGPIQNVLSDNQGRALIAGQFTQFDDHNSSRLARVLTNGLVDTSFRCQFLKEADPLSIIEFSFWKNDPAQGVFFVSRLPMGNQNGFIFHISSNGDIDTSFFNPNLAIPGAEIKEVLAAHQMPSGHIWVSVRLKIEENENQCYLIKLLPNGQPDPGYNPTYLHEIYSGLPAPYWGGPFVRAIQRLDENRLAVGIQYQYIDGFPDPPCKQAATEFYSYWISIVLDTNGVASGEGNPMMQNLEFCKDYERDLSIPFLSHSLDVFQGPEVPYYRLFPNFSIDSSFRLRYPDGGIGNFLTPPFPRRPLLLTRKGDYFFSYFKSTNEGIVDTSFRYKCLPNNMAEPDTAHLYLAGGFQIFGEKVAPYLVRVHNQTSIVTRLSDLRKSSQVVLYPNPVGETVHIAGWKPGMVLRITSVEGKILFEGMVQEQTNPAILGLGHGLYFWSASYRGQPLGGGRLIR